MSSLKVLPTTEVLYHVEGHWKTGNDFCTEAFSYTYACSYFKQMQHHQAVRDVALIRTRIKRQSVKVHRV